MEENIPTKKEKILELVEEYAEEYREAHEYMNNQWDRDASKQECQRILEEISKLVG